MDLASKSITVFSPEGLDQFALSIENAELGLHLGIFTRLKIGSIFLQPELIFNSNKVNYKWDNISRTNDLPQFLSESYNYLDMPIKLGIKKGIFAFHTGPVGHYFINSSSELWQISEYGQKFDNFNWSWELGIGIEFLFVKFDIRYDRNLNNFGDHIILYGKQYDFGNAASKWVASAYLSI